MCSFRNEKILFKIHSKGSHGFSLPFQCYRIQYYTITNQIDCSLVKYPRRNLVQNNFFAFRSYIKRMTSIGSSLEPCNHIIFRSKIIYNLSFTLITPLKSENYINHIFFIDGGKCTSQKNAISLRLMANL